jgi:hypothetical protein
VLPESSDQGIPVTRSNAGIRLDALLELVIDLNHGVADLIDLVALPGETTALIATSQSHSAGMGDIW